MPLSAPTPSRRFRQQKISDCINGFQKNSPSSRNTENTKPTADLVSYPELPPLDKKDVMEICDESQDKLDNYESASEEFDGPRKVARTRNNTSPTKQTLWKETADSMTSFVSTSTIPDEITPSTKLNALTLTTTAASARREAERRFDSITPVKRPDFKAPNGAKHSATPADLGNPFMSSFRAPTVDQTPGGSKRPGDEIIDAELEIFAILKKAKVTLPEPFHKEMQQLATRITFKQRGYKQSRDTNRDLHKKEKERLEAEREILIDKLESSTHLQKTDKASISSQQSEIEDLKKQVETLKSQLCHLENIEDEKVMLQDKYEELNQVLAELGG
ncbi:hypothetical protein TWF694_008419 [Orbilia ellipsospora]